MNTAIPLIELREIWVYLTGSPLASLVLTLIAYQMGLMIYERFDKNPVVNPVAIAILIVIGTISLMGMPYAEYFEGAQFIHFLLGTATVALAVPIYKGWHLLKGRTVPLSIALVAGGGVLRGLAILGGPIGLAITTILTVPAISGAAYRVTIPSVIQIAYMRRAYEEQDRF